MSHESIAKPESGAGPKKIILAVHGVGDQTRYTTIQSALFQFCHYFGAPAGTPLGMFNTPSLPLSMKCPPYPSGFGNLAFAEVYWADIPRANANEYELEEAKSWAKTIVARVRQSNQEGYGGRLQPEDFSLMEQVLNELLEGLGVLERLCYLADKAGLFKFDVNKVIVDYLDDVQVMAEFPMLREKIVARFCDALKAMHEADQDAELYIIAHSEGTVVALLGLLDGMSRDAPPPWLKNVRGFMTIGSPIDKHLILWPSLFAQYKTCGRDPKVYKPIEWRNYYDYGDPIGFQLDEARGRIETGDWAGFKFDKDSDYGFARYPFPGKAHNDYWCDAAVFGHFISTVVGVPVTASQASQGAGAHLRRTPPHVEQASVPPPRDKWWARSVSYVVPYLIAAILMFTGVFLLYKAVLELTHSTTALRQVHIVDIFSYTLLLAGLTVMARLPRLTRQWRWWALGSAVFILAATVCTFTLDGDRWSHIGVAVVVALIACGVNILRNRIPSPGTKSLLALGCIGTAVVVWSYVETTGHPGPLWPVFLAGALFAYLWWLGILIFDLTFIWHRYIRMSMCFPALKAAQNWEAVA